MDNTQLDWREIFIQNQFVKQELILLILQCPSIANNTSRQVIISELSNEIKNSLPASNSFISSKTEIAHLLKVSSFYEGGIDNLVGIIKFYDEGTKQYNDLQKFISHLQNELPLAQTQNISTIRRINTNTRKNTNYREFRQLLFDKLISNLPVISALLILLLVTAYPLLVRRMMNTYFRGWFDTIVFILLYC